MTDVFHSSPTSRALGAGKGALGIVAFGLLLCASVSGWAATTYYRWVDDQGVTHYTSTPPKGIAAEKVTSATRAGTAPAPEAQADQKRAETESASAAQQQAASLKDPERCAIARERAKTLETNRRIRMQKDDGQFHYLSQEEIQEELDASRQAIKESC